MPEPIQGLRARLFASSRAGGAQPVSFSALMGNPFRETLYLVLILAANTKYSINNLLTPAICDVFGAWGDHKK